MSDLIISAITRHLEWAVKGLPSGFYNSFDYTATGRNVCHSITVGLLVHAVAQVDSVEYVGVDVKLNRGGKIKFQPDVVGFGEDLGHRVYVDFESPNSCDARLPEKDIRKYIKWISDGRGTPYIIITSLPTKSAPRWPLRYSSDLNAEHRNSRTEMRANPLNYWSGVWRDELAGADLSHVTLLNIDGRSVQKISISS